MATMIRVSKTGEPDPPQVFGAGDRSKFKQDFDLRDIINMGVGGKHKDLSNADLRTNYQWLAGKIGVPAAQKLMNKILIYNQQTANSQLPDEERIKAFYDTPGDDEEVSTIIKTAKGLGYGIGEGVRSSRHAGVADIAGTDMVMVPKTMLKVKK